MPSDTRRPALAALAPAVALLMFSTTLAAAEKTAALHRITADGAAEAVGTITFSDSTHGLLVTPALHDVPSQGAHGTHIHARPDCGAKMVDGTVIPGAAAGGHYDPEHTQKHAGPYANGHLGDLPNLIVAPDGHATIPVLAPRLKTSDLDGRAVMMHAAPDRYQDHGKHKHGKGGMRMYCGVIR